MDIVVVAQYMSNIVRWKECNGRFIYIVQMLKEEATVEIITTDFFHDTKKHFEDVKEIDGIKVTMCHEPGYSKNICLKRFLSHKVLARNIGMYLEKRKKPDVLYAAVPSLSVAEVCADYCKKNNVKFIIDIQDLWPEAFKMVMNIPVISDMGFWPMKIQADKIYAAADEIVAVSQTYVDRAMIVNKKCQQPHIVYLGTEKETFDRFADSDQPAIVSKKLREVLDSSVLKLVYCGTLGASYDITCVLDAIRHMTKEEQKRIKFIVMGDGPRRAEFEKASEGLPCIFTGRLSYSNMVWVLSRCNIAVNPITKGAAQSIINKHMDYAMAGLPVINTQECVEYRQMIEKYHAGINCRCNNWEDVQKAIFALETNFQTMGKQSRIMAEENFDRARTYEKIKEIVIK